MVSKRKRGNENGSPKNHVRKKKKILPQALKKNEHQALKKNEPNVPTPGSNWQKMKSKLQGPKTSSNKKHDLDVVAQKQKIKEMKAIKRKEGKKVDWIDNTNIVAMDCEMVGVGASGKQSVLARCSIVDYDGNVLYDKNVRPVEKVTDFRTHVSGIRSKSLRNAIPFQQCIKEVGKFLKNKIVVGHALKNDFSALMFTPPKHLIRDTAKYRPYMRRKAHGTKLYPKALRVLAEEVLGIIIQGGEHDSVEDARATLALYKREQYAWEKCLKATKKYGSIVGKAPPIPVKEQQDRKKLANMLDIDKEDDDDDEDDILPSSKSRRWMIPDSKALANLEYDE